LKGLIINYIIILLLKVYSIIKGVSFINYNLSYS